MIGSTARITLESMGVSFPVQMTANTGVSLGCHSTAISNVCITYAFGKEGVKNVDKSPLKMGTQIQEYKDSWTGETRTRFNPAYAEDMQKELDKATKVKEETIDTMFKILLKNITTDMSFLSARVNWGGKSNGKRIGYLADTYSFVKWLIANKVGHVTASPIVRNKNYPSVAGYGLVQSWVWINPTSLPWVVPESGKLYNNKSLPDWDAWYKRVGTDIGFPEDHGKVDEYMWPNGRYVRPEPPRQSIFEKKVA